MNTRDLIPPSRAPDLQALILFPSPSPSPSPSPPQYSHRSCRLTPHTPYCINAFSAQLGPSVQHSCPHALISIIMLSIFCLTNPVSPTHIPWGLTIEFALSKLIPSHTLSMKCRSLSSRSDHLWLTCSAQSYSRTESRARIHPEYW